MGGTTRAQAPRELKRPSVRGQPRSRVLASQERADTPATGSRSQASMRGQRSPSVQPNGGLKRKDRDFEPESAVGDTNIRVVVRCRGRSEREVKENSGVVVSTGGTTGSTVELSMGPNALGNKAYQFDKVFSPAADQEIVYDDVVMPIVTEMLAGYNCTIFAYGQTGTGKTYTMSGEMTDTLGLLADGAGIIPRVLYSLFQKLEDQESSVKCSFLELYNEELKDLLSSDDGSKLKIYEDGAKKGHNSTMVQGISETFVNTATEGIKLLQEGSHRRQVAATKCNDLSSRSHTVFTITAFMKRATDKGEDFVSTGKLNLVDLAGSENIQRSGAENKRAAEAGVINKSLLTLGRVINALVDKNQHIPYRESKLTRLLQDSLGGHTKTCIIATISAARSNLEETISTLDYAFRAKNIRNKPQINSTTSKKTLLREFTTEIEKLKSDLIATRQRNGVYMSPGAYEEMTVESESRRILTEEQRAKIETMETNLKNKVHELFTLTSNFNNLKKDNESTRTALEQAEGVLEKTELILRDTRQNLGEESELRKAHEATENQLQTIGTNLLSTLQKSVADVTELHSKVERQDGLHDRNRGRWDSSTSQVLDATRRLGDRVIAFQAEQSRLITNLSSNMQSFVSKEQETLGSGDEVIKNMELGFDTIQEHARERLSQDRDNMNDVLEEIKVLREDVKQKVGEGLGGLSSAAARISGEVVQELERFHVELCTMYDSQNKAFSTIFETLVQQVKSQSEEANRLRQDLQDANQKAMKAEEQAEAKLEAIMDEERREADENRAALISQIDTLIRDMGDKQAARLERKVRTVQDGMRVTRSSMWEADRIYGVAMDKWSQEQDNFVDEIRQSEKGLTTKMGDDLNTLDTWNNSIKANTSAVNGETVRIVDKQKEDMAEQMQALDEFVTRARSQNDSHHESNVQTLSSLADKVSETHQQVRRYLDDLKDQARDFESRATKQNSALQESVDGLTGTLSIPLCELQADVQDVTMTDYTPTGNTPPKAVYEYPTLLPRTEPHENLLARMRGPDTPARSSNRSNHSTPATQHSASLIGSHSPSPSKAPVYNDVENVEGACHPSAERSPAKPDTSSANASTGLREIDVNVVPRPQESRGHSMRSGNSDSVTLGVVAGAGGHNNVDEDSAPQQEDLLPPPAKRRLSSSAGVGAKTLGGDNGVGGTRKVVDKVGMRRQTRRSNMSSVGDGRENIPPPVRPPRARKGLRSNGL